MIMIKLIIMQNFFKKYVLEKIVICLSIGMNYFAIPLNCSIGLYFICIAIYAVY